MAGVLTTKVRLVRCPKCKLLLPELPDFNVYKCGGCGATLIAKHRATIPNPNENRNSCASEEKEEHRLANKDVALCSGECSSSQNDESDQSKNGDCYGLVFPKKDSIINNNSNGIRRRSNGSDFYNEGSEMSSEVYSPTEFFDDKSEDFALNRGVSEQANEELSSSEFDMFGHGENENEEFARNENDGSSHDENEEERFRGGNEEFARHENEESSRDENEEQCFPDENEEERFRTKDKPMSLSLARADVVEPGVDPGRLSLAEKATTEDTIYNKGNSDYDYDYDYDYCALKQPRNSAHWGFSHNQSHELRGAYLGETSSKSPTRLPHAYGGTESYDEVTNIRREKFMAQAALRNSWLDKNHHPSGPRNWSPEREHEDQKRSYEKFQRHSSFQSHFSEDPENVVKLLRMVLQAQKQSSKSGSLYETGPSQKPMYEYDPRYHHHHSHHEQHNFEALQRDHHYHHHHNHQYGYSEDPRNLRRYTYQPRLNKIPFSDQLGASCSHCFPRERSYHNDPGRLHLGQKPRPVPKRHFRPVARGAPFAICTRCLNILLLPADFLLSKRKRHHRLRCGACSQILEFSLEKGSHIVGLAPKLAGPPPPPSSMVEPFSSSPVTQSQIPRDSVDYGRSNHRQSISAKEKEEEEEEEEEDQDQSPSTPVPTPLGRAFDRIIFGVSYPPEDSSSELVVPEPSRGRYKDRPPRPESSRPASKIMKPRVVDDEEQGSTSPLHRLMGYSSPSQVIYGSRTNGLGGSSNSFSIRREQY